MTVSFYLIRITTKSGSTLKLDWDYKKGGIIKSSAYTIDLSNYKSDIEYYDTPEETSIKAYFEESYDNSAIDLLGSGEHPIELYNNKDLSFLYKNTSPITIIEFQEVYIKNVKSLLKNIKKVITTIKEKNPEFLL